MCCSTGVRRLGGSPRVGATVYTLGVMQQRYEELPEEDGVAKLEMMVRAVRTVLIQLPVTGTGEAAASSQGWSELKYQTFTMDVPPAPALSQDGGGLKKTGKVKSSIVLKTIGMVNTEVVPKGSRLYVAHKPPTALVV